MYGILFSQFCALIYYRIQPIAMIIMIMIVMLILNILMTIMAQLVLERLPWSDPMIDVE